MDRHLLLHAKKGLDVPATQLVEECGRAQDWQTLRDAAQFVYRTGQERTLLLGR